MSVKRMRRTFLLMQSVLTTFLLRSSGFLLLARNTRVTRLIVERPAFALPVFARFPAWWRDLRRLPGRKDAFPAFALPLSLSLAFAFSFLAAFLSPPRPRTGVRVV